MFDRFFALLPKLISSKIILMCGLTAILSSTVVGSVAYIRSEANTLEMALENVTGETRLIAGKLKQAYLDIKNDAFVISKMPPIEGIIRTQNHNGIDPLDGSSAAHWKGRLEKIFTSIMSVRPHYSQMRYIGFQNDGRELVRVNRTADGFERVTVDRLQKKGDEPYLQAARKLKPNDFLFSDVTYNRENGVIVEPKVAMLRTIVPVFDSGKPFGVIVINADYQKALTLAFRKIQPRGDLYVSDGGRFLLDFQNGQLVVNYLKNPDYAELRKLTLKVEAPAGDAQASYVGDRYVNSMVGVSVDDRATLGVIVRAPRDVVLAKIASLRQASLLTGGLLTLVALIGALLVSRRLTQPLKTMALELGAIDARNRAMNLPTDRQDEIGEVARAFQVLTRDLIDSEAKIGTIVQSMFDGLITTDARGFIEKVNPASQKIFGYEKEELVGKNLKVLLPTQHRDRHDHYISRYKRTGERRFIGAIREVEGRRKDGSIFPLEVSITEIVIAGERHFVGTLRDITARRDEEKQREYLIERLKRSNDELDNFAHIASHDLKEPLRAIHNHCSFLFEDYGAELPEGCVKRLNRLQFLAKRMEKLISDLLKYSRLAQQEPSVKPTDLNTVVADIELTMKDVLQEAAQFGDERHQVQQSEPKDDRDRLLPRW